MLHPPLKLHPTLGRLRGARGAPGGAPAGAIPGSPARVQRSERQLLAAAAWDATSGKALIELQTLLELDGAAAASISASSSVAL